MTAFPKDVVADLSRRIAELEHLLRAALAQRDVAIAHRTVIATDNARLLGENKEALEHQTATAEILKVIASSPSDVQPVFDVIVEHAVRLCGGRMGRVYRYGGGIIQMVAGHGLASRVSARCSRFSRGLRRTTRSLAVSCYRAECLFSPILKPTGPSLPCRAR